VEEHAAQDHVLEVVEVLVELKLDVEAVLDAHLHFHLGGLLGLLHVTVVVQDREVSLFADGGFHVAVHDGPDEVPDPPGDTVEGLILLLEVGEPELEGLGFCQDAGGLQFFLKGVELG
jgi:hypothetical protein